jgi:hypothetical protein
MSSFSVKTPQVTTTNIRGIPIESSAPENGESLLYNSTTNNFVYENTRIERVQNTSSDPINLTTDITLLNNSSTGVQNYTLANGATGQTKIISSINKTMGIVLTSRGVTEVNPGISRTLMYYNDQWNNLRKVSDQYNWFVSRQQGNKLVGSGNVGAAQQGFSVALSADGNTLASGGNADAGNTGAVWVFTRSGTDWSQQTQNKLVGTGGITGAQQGYSVALSADGNTLASGGPTDVLGTGAVWIYTRSGTTWAQQGSKVFAATGGAQQGFSVALSADGNTLASGGPAFYGNSGSTWVFTRSGSTWSSQTGLFGTGGGITGAQQGYSVALSADGNTLASGAPTDVLGTGAVWIYTRSGSTWSQQGAKLTGLASTGAQQGYSVALSADGNTLASGGPADTSGTGAIWIFTRSGSTWAQQGPKLIAVGGTGIGSSVALSADGNTLASGGYIDNNNSGAVWIFTRSGSNWTQQGIKLTGGGNVGAAYQGKTVALSADGNTLASGGYADNTSAGAVWTFV